MRRVVSLLVLSITTLLKSPAFAHDYRNEWQAEGWYGYDAFEEGVFNSCGAGHYIAVDRQGHPTLALTTISSPEAPASDLALWDVTSRQGDLRQAARPGTVVTVSIGGTRRDYDVGLSLRNMVSVRPQSDIIQLLADGGPVSFRPPHGRGYFFTLPHAQAAMTSYRKCLARNGLPVT